MCMHHTRKLFWDGRSGAKLGPNGSVPEASIPKAKHDTCSHRFRAGERARAVRNPHATA